MQLQVYAGNARLDPPQTHVDDLTEPHTRGTVLITSDTFPAGSKGTYSSEQPHASLVILVDGGPFVLEYPDQEVALAERGDYAVWGRGIDHSWHVPGGATVITVRWPSTADPAGARPYTGSAPIDAKTDFGWLVGHFKDPADPRHSDTVEIKWGEHPAGDRRSEWVTGDRRTALMILVDGGPFVLEYPDQEVALAERGDYAVWGRGVDHSWHVPGGATVITVRSPSISGYQADNPR